MDDYSDFNFSVTYPVVQWNNGARSQKSAGGVPYTGGWLLPAGDLPKGVKINSVWKGPVDWTFESGKSERVYVASEVFVALLRRRRRWFGINDAGVTVYYTDAQARGRRDLRSHVQVLGVVMGCPTPVVISVKGERSRALDKALSEFYQKVILPANEAAGAKLPLYAYWCKIGSSVAVLGDDGFITVGTGKATKVVTVPTLIVPETVDEAYLQKAAVPDQLRARCAVWRAEAEAWSTEWQYNPNSGNGHEAPTAPVAPQQDEEDIPY